jgi:hypothetical protein
MKQIIILIIAVIVFSVSYAQTEDWLWTAQGGGGSTDEGKAIAVDSSGNTYVTGAFNSTATFGEFSLVSSGSSDIFIAKIDPNGNYLWATRAGGSGTDSGYGIATDSSGNCYVTGAFSSTATFGETTLISSAGFEIFTAKLSANGNFLWAQRGGGNGNDYGRAIATDSSGNCYVTGYIQYGVTFGAISFTGLGAFEVFIAKLDTDGNYLWAIPAGGGSTDYAWGIASDSSGNIYVTGYFNGTATFGTTSLTSVGSSDVFVAKLDTDGNWLWAKKAGGSSLDVSMAIAIDSSGNSYITGSFWSDFTFGTTSFIGMGGYNSFIAKLDPDGNYLWAKQAGGDDTDRGYGIATNSNGDCYVTGIFASISTFGSTILTSNGNSDIFIAKLDTYGNWIWVKQIGSTTYDYGNGITTDSNGNCYATGSFKYTTAFGSSSLVSRGDADIYVCKLGPSYLIRSSVSAINFGTVHQGTQCIPRNVWLKNNGTGMLSITAYSFFEGNSFFSIEGIYLPINLASGDSVAIPVRFTPYFIGTISDSLFIINSSTNLPRLGISLLAIGAESPPRPPDNVQLAVNGNNAVLTWDAVTQTLIDTPVVPDFYLLFFNGSTDSEGLYYFLGLTPGLTFTHQYVLQFSPNMFYRVVAYKNYARGDGDYLSLGLVPGMREDEVMRILAGKQ